jgi:ribosomal protein S18 acetylase RimI-like enzyme
MNVMRKEMIGVLPIMPIENCTKEDFDKILSNIPDYWGSDRTLHLHLPILLYEFGDTAFVLKNDGFLCGYLFGLFAQTGPYAYVQFIGVHMNCRRKGYGRALYDRFELFARERRCTYIKAITSFLNKESINFHQSIGMELVGEDEKDGTRFVKNYSGPNEDRVVFSKSIS